MDRKAWIVVILCAMGIAANTWYGATHQPPPPPPSATPAGLTPEAAAPTTAATTPGAPGAPAGTPGVNNDLPEEQVKLVAGQGNTAVTFTLTSFGGGIAKTETLKEDGSADVVLNEKGQAPICGLSLGAFTYRDVRYRVVEKSSTRVVFEGETPEKLTVRKEYYLADGIDPHVLNFKLSLTNHGEAQFTHDDYYLYTGAASELRPGEILTSSGFVWNNGGDADQKATQSFHEEPGFFGMSAPVTQFQNAKPFESVRWAGVMSRFYTTLLATKEDQPGKVWSTRFLIDHSRDEFKNDSNASKDYAVHGGLSLPPVDLAPKASKTYEFQLYIGPKVYKTLAKLDRQQELVMFYGWFSWFSRLFVSLMRIFHDWFNNWGCAILLLTFCIRMCLWPIQARSNKTMKRMGALQKPMKELQERYKDDPQKLNTEVMKLYREYGVNPIGGCLPIFLQIPIFLGFYNMLRSAAELRGQGFLWVKDLSLPDTIWHVPGYNFPINVLPLLMGVTMIAQFKLTPQPPTTDKAQARMMMFMPLIFLWISYNYASALALYWTAQNIISIAQAQIQRRFSKDQGLLPPKPGGSSGGGGSSPMSPFGPSSKKKKDKPTSPRLGGGGTKSARK